MFLSSACGRVLLRVPLRFADGGPRTRRGHQRRASGMTTYIMVGVYESASLPLLLRVCQKDGDTVPANDRAPAHWVATVDGRLWAGTSSCEGSEGDGSRRRDR